MTFDLNKFDVKKFDSILSRGLCYGLGKQGQQVCIEAAICETLGLPHSDDPKCVSGAVRAFKIRLNDSRWSSSQARAKGMRDLGIAQLGSLGVVDDVAFVKKIAEKTTRRLLPVLYRQLWPNDAEVEAAAARCEQEGTADAARAACNIVYKRYAADAAAYAATYAADAADAATSATYATYAADAAAYAADAAAYASDKYLVLAAELALETLRELKSPGCALLDGAE